jgi:hypothetical protein
MNMPKIIPARTPHADEVAQQRLLDEHVSKLCDAAGKLIPLGEHSSFPSHRPADPKYYYDEQLGTLAWSVVATKLGHIDHAWMFGFRDPPQEPWGFITEPYLGKDEAPRIIAAAEEAMPWHEWGVTFHWLPAELSSWNPGSCTPLIARVDNISSLLRTALRHWLTAQERV